MNSILVIILRYIMLKGFKKNKIASFLILLGTIIWSLTMVKSGIVYDFGAGFWGPNGHDGIWHIALSNSLARGGWEMPIFAGEAIKNYHVGYDLLLAAIHKLTFIPISNLYFQIFPPALAMLIGIFVYKFVYLWKNSKIAAFWATFFVYFSGSFGWLVTLVKNRSIDGESLFWAQQSVSTLINPPFALSLVVIFYGLTILVKSLRVSKKKSYLNKRNLALVTILFGILVQIKIYASVLVLGGLFIAGLWRLVKRKGNILFKVFSGSLIISMLLFLPLNEGAGSTIVFKPFWFVETMMSFNDRVGWGKFGEAMVNYKLGGVWLKAISAYALAFLIFLIGNMGMRIFSFGYLYKSIKGRKLSYLEILIYSVIVGGIIAPMLFVQSGTAWNTIQFFYYSLVFMGILAGISFADLLQKINSTTLHRVVVVFVVALTVPTVIATLRHYLPKRPPAMVSMNEIEALKFLEEQPDGIVLVLPFGRELAQKLEIDPPRPLYLYESTAYVSAYTGKQSYLEDEVNLEITGYDWRGRREKIGKFFLAQSEEEAGVFLKENNITYFYWNKALYGLIRGDQSLVENIFENTEIVIYKTKIN